MTVKSVRLTLPEEAAETFGDLLLEKGALAVSVEDAQAGTQEERPLFGEPGAAPGLWPSCEVIALFNVQADAAQILQSCADAMGMSLPSFRQEAVEDRDWVLANREQFKPLCVSDRLWIVPSWHADTQLPAGAMPIFIDPGAAFGTGSHPTTRLCLRWLENALTRNPGGSVIDYGCGSGILAIAAAKLGAKTCVGVDIDEQALETARHNAQQNGVSVDFRSAAALSPAPADLVVANILSHPLIMLAPLLSQCVATGGQLALSGILEAQAEEVIEGYRPWINLGVHGRDEDWVCLSGPRSS